ncbi:MAG TPA: CDP-alcohol phosphatidyltransferase family protein [Gaiellaceae bacterium]|nr:CDP-alcohol phosphatidyltransferase family protein [Gaiellaceae bacterium]
MVERAAAPFGLGALPRAVPGPLAGLAAQLLLLAALGETIGLGRAGWASGAAAGLILDVMLARALWRDAAARLGPADWVTLTRATFAVGVAALTAESLAGHSATAVLVVLASLALALDFVDGRVARHTNTESALGAKLDGEVDAFLILVLSVAVAPSAGAWVLAIGAMRYAFLAAGAFTWMRAALPRRDWRKTVTATQGIALTLAAAEILPTTADRAVLGVALALLAESFGRDVLWLWRHRTAAGSQTTATRHRNRAVDVLLTSLAVAVLWTALVAPVQPWRLTPTAFLRLPLEGIVIVLLAVTLPDRGRRVLAWAAGPAVGVLVLVKLLDIGFFVAFDRPFNPVDDWSYASIGIETVRDTFGRTDADLVAAAAVALAVLALVLPTLAVLRLTRVAAGHRRGSLRALGALGTVWVACWALGASTIASTSGADLAVAEVRAVRSDLRDHARFKAELRRDRFGAVAAGRLLTALRGKDVLLVFVESYGKLAVEGTSFSPRIDAVLDNGTQQLATAGFSARSAWLTSSTFGGGSWWAHATLQSGTWVDSQGRYEELVGSDRLTLTKAFGEAGWRTVADVPSDTRDWPEGTSFYRYDRIYDRRSLGYHGPKYAFASMPDQYVLLALQRQELATTDRPPIFSEIDLVSSHTPWTRIPPLIAWGRVGNGSIFERLPIDKVGLTDAAEGYAQSISYTLRALFSFVEHYGTRNTVLIVLGDHQPSRVVSGSPGHDVPVSIIARDPAVLRRIAGWGWVDGMRPTDAAPTWLMSTFRNRFLGTFGP